MVSRRAVLGGVTAAAAAVTVGAIPQAAADADLDVTIDVRDWHLSDREQIDSLDVKLTNNEDRAIDPVWICWSSTRMTQQPWDRSGPATIAPGSTAEYRLTAPKSACSVRLRPNTTSQIEVYDRGTEQRHAIAFVPKIDEDRLGSDGQDECGEYTDI